jgi:hypothetical protein
MAVIQTTVPREALTQEWWDPLEVEVLVRTQP